YLIFFCPLNLFYKCVAFLPVKLILVAMKEVVRVRKIAAGIHHAHHAYHNGWVIMVLTGWVKGEVLALWVHPGRGQCWGPVICVMSSDLFSLLPSSPTKASLYGAIVFTLQQTHWLPVSKNTLILLFTLFMAASKVFMTATHSHSSPFMLVESMLCKVLFSSTAGSAPHDSHAVSHDAPPSPAKSKEELNEGARKRKAKKAE
ncbi:trimeric intracellular cation channel type A-like, partial [Huso huso]